MTAELAPLLQPEPELTWQPSGDEPQACDPAVVSDLSCVGEAYGVRFTSAVQPQARVIIWFYPAAREPGCMSFTVSWRWRLEHGPWQAMGHDSAARLFANPEDAADAALEVACDLACGHGHRYLGGHPACLFWDGAPW